MSELVTGVLDFVGEVDSPLHVGALALVVIGLLVWKVGKRLPKHRTLVFVVAVIVAVVVIVVAVSFDWNGDGEEIATAVDQERGRHRPQPEGERTKLFTIGSGLGPGLDRVVWQQSKATPEVGDAILVSIVPDLLGTYQYTWDFSNCSRRVTAIAFRGGVRGRQAGRVPSDLGGLAA